MNPMSEIVLPPARFVMRFEVPGIPVAKGRPRVTKRGITYTPKESVRFENLVRLFAQNAGMHMVEGPVELRIAGYWPCKGPPRTKNPRRATFKTTRPDLDNCIKAIGDALNGIAYKDDSQVVSVVARKLHAAQGEPPRTIVEVVPVKAMIGQPESN